jgi:VanZ family protein
MKTFLIRFLFLDLPVLTWMGLIVHLASRPTSPPTTDLPLDKVMHFGAYALLALGIARACHGRLGPSGTTFAAFTSLTVASLHGLFIEIHQMSLPHRSAEWADLLADMLGAGCCALAWWIFYRESNRSKTEAG